MRPVFDAIDAGRYDAVLLAVAALFLLAASAEWLRMRRAR